MSSSPIRKMLTAKRTPLTLAAEAVHEAWVDPTNKPAAVAAVEAFRQWSLGLGGDGGDNYDYLLQELDLIPEPDLTAELNQARRESEICAEIIANLRADAEFSDMVMNDLAVRLKRAEEGQSEIAGELYEVCKDVDAAAEELGALRRKRRNESRRARRRLAKERKATEAWRDEAFSAASREMHAEAERQTLQAGMEEREAEIAALRACSAAEANLISNLEAENIRQTRRAEEAEARAAAAEEQMRKLVRVHRIWGPPDDGDTPFQNMMINLERSYGGR